MWPKALHNLAFTISLTSSLTTPPVGYSFLVNRSPCSFFSHSNIPGLFSAWKTIVSKNWMACSTSVFSQVGHLTYLNLHLNTTCHFSPKIPNTFCVWFLSLAFITIWHNYSVPVSGTLWYSLNTTGIFSLPFSFTIPSS